MHRPLLTVGLKSHPITVAHSTLQGFPKTQFPSICQNFFLFLPLKPYSVKGYSELVGVSVSFFIDACHFRKYSVGLGNLF